MEPIEEAAEMSDAEQLRRRSKDKQKKVGVKQTFRAFTHRNYRLFFAGQLISLIGTWLNNTAEGWLVYQLTGSKVLLGTVAAVSTAPMLILSTYGGWLADQIPKRSILVATQICSMLLSLTLAFLVWRNLIQPWQLIALAAAGGVVMAFDMPARQAFVIEMTSREDMVNAISLNSAMFNGARIVGPSIAGILMAHTGIAMCFFLDGVSFIAVIIGLLMMQLAPHSGPVHQESPFEGAVSGFRYVKNDPRLLRIFFLFSVVGIFGWSYSVLMPALAQDVLKVSEMSYGMLLASNGVGALAGALTIAAAGHVLSPRKLALGGVWIFSAMIICFALTRTFWIALLCLAGSGFGLLLFFSSANSAVQTSVQDNMRGRVMGIWALVFGGAVPIGSMEAGTLAHWIGAPSTIVLGAILCALAAGATSIHARRQSIAEAAAQPS